MKYQYLDSFWCNNDFYDVPFDRVGLCITLQIETIINDIQGYIKAHHFIDEVTVNFHLFDLLKEDELSEEFPSIGSSHLVINYYGYSLKLCIDENIPITIEAY